MFHLDAHPDARKLMRSRLYLIALILVFIGPLVASTVLYYNPQLRTGLGGVSNGELILPPRLVDTLPLDQKDGKPRWSLLYRASKSSCDLDCEATLFMMRQVRQSLGSKRDRTQLLVFLDNKKNLRDYAPMLQRLGPHRLVLQILINSSEDQASSDPRRMIINADWLLPPVFKTLPDSTLDALTDWDNRPDDSHVGTPPPDTLYLEGEQARWGHAAARRQGLVPAVRPGQLIARWSDKFKELPPDTLYLIDPLGNLFMHYTPESTSRGLLKDLKRLLAASRIG